MVKGKELSYEAQEPAFLRRLRATQAGRGDPDRHERPIARPMRAKKGGAEDDDEGPTIVDEENDRTLTREEYETLLKVETAQTENVAASATEGEPVAKKTDTLPESSRLKQEVAELGKQKKRKAAKVVGDDDENEVTHEGAKATTKKPKKKTKAVALSFDDEAG